MALTDEERFLFDLNGFLVREAILTPAEIEAISDQVVRLHTDPGSLPPEHRGIPGGPASVLIDHPKVVDVLTEVIGPDLRLENCFPLLRTQGRSHPQGLHAGGRDWADPIFGYRVNNGRIYAGVVRVVFELTDVKSSDGATVFVPGSHRAHFALPPSIGVDSPWVRSYDCPAGSAIFFTEQLLHAGARWTRETPRIAVLHAYSHVATSFHRLTVAPEVLAALPRAKQSWFREPWLFDFRTGPATRNSAERFRAGDEPPIDTTTRP